jgi:hypothetical protein
MLPARAGQGMEPAYSLVLDERHHAFLGELVVILEHHTAAAESDRVAFLSEVPV